MAYCYWQELFWYVYSPFTILNCSLWFVGSLTTIKIFKLLANIVIRQLQSIIVLSTTGISCRLQTATILFILRHPWLKGSNFTTSILLRPPLCWHTRHDPSETTLVVPLSLCPQCLPCTVLIYNSHVHTLPTQLPRSISNNFDWSLVPLLISTPLHHPHIPISNLSCPPLCQCTHSDLSITLRPVSPPRSRHHQLHPYPASTISISIQHHRTLNPHVHHFAMQSPQSIVYYFDPALTSARIHFSTVPISISLSCPPLCWRTHYNLSSTQ